MIGWASFGAGGRFHYFRQGRSVCGRLSEPVFPTWLDEPPSAAICCLNCMRKVGVPA